MARAEFSGRPAAPGTAIGRLVRLGASAVQPRRAGTPEQEAAALAGAIAAAAADLAALAAQAGSDAAGIIEFQAAMLQDEALRAPALAAIASGAAADAAWAAALGVQVAEYEVAEDAYFRARAIDLRDLAERVLRHLGGAAAVPALPLGAIVLADDLTPSLFLETDWRGGGIALSAGSPASHVAMLARARGVPMVVGLGPVAAAAGETAALDGAAGVLLLGPDDADRARFATAAAADFSALLHRPAATAAGRRVAVLLNVADPRELDRLDPALCDGIGLVRTELMFAAGPPDEDTQLRAYRRILQWAGDRPVTIRTLDAGGDKPVPGLTMPGESNPFLGQRGLRLSLARPDVFAVQLRALVRAAAHGTLKIMLPMVTVPEELQAARALLDQAGFGRGRGGAAARDHGRSAGGGAGDRAVRRGVLFHRHQRPGAIRHRQRPRHRRGGAARRPAQPGGAAPDRRGGGARRAGRAGGRRVRRRGGRSGIGAVPARCRHRHPVDGTQRGRPGQGGDRRPRRSQGD